MKVFAQGTFVKVTKICIKTEVNECFNKFYKIFYLKTNSEEGAVIIPILIALNNTEVLNEAYKAFTEQKVVDCNGIFFNRKIPDIMLLEKSCKELYADFIAKKVEDGIVFKKTHLTGMLCNNIETSKTIYNKQEEVSHFSFTVNVTEEPVRFELTQGNPKDKVYCAVINEDRDQYMNRVAAILTNEDTLPVKRGESLKGKIFNVTGHFFSKRCKVSPVVDSCQVGLHSLDITYAMFDKMVII